MSEIVSKWIQHRLGLVIDMSAENFAIKTANGKLLAQILHSYQIIVLQQLNLILETDLIKECYENFKLIKEWLANLNIKIPDEDLYEIVHGVGTASLHLFYQVLLELKDRTQLDFLTDNEINSQLANKFSRFQVTRVETKENPNKIDLHREGLCELLVAGGDVYHWYKDRMENLQSRCREARDEYVHIIKTRCRSCGIGHALGTQESGFVLPRSLVPSPRPSFYLSSNNELLDEDISYNSKTYDYLISQQKEAQQLQPIMPDDNEVKKIMKNLKTKHKIRYENKILRNELHQEIMNEFDGKINQNKMKSQDKVLTKIFLRQTCFEKELVSKMGQVKMQKEFMIENKFKQAETLAKLKEKELIDSLVLQEKELNEKKLIYYLERERILHLHRQIWEERLRLRAKRNENICSNALKDIVDISMKISEYTKMFGHEPTRREMDELKNIFTSGQSVFDICEPVVSIIKDRDEDMVKEEIITMETLRQNALDQEEFDNYMHYDWPWELKNIEITSETLIQISCGLNVLGHLVHQALLAKYPLPPLGERPSFPDTTVRVCINGINDTTCLQFLRNLLSEREIHVIELSDAVNFCLNACQQESKREYEEEEITSIKEGKKKKKEVKQPKKGEKSKSKKKEDKSDDADLFIGEIPKVFENKIVQTPIIFPSEEIVYSPEGMLGKTAQEMLNVGESLTDYLLIAMFVEYLKSIANLKGWALINYPTTYEQAAILEETFTGIRILGQEKKLPDSKVVLEFAHMEETNEKDACSLEQGVEMTRKSRLLPNPIIPKPVKIYDTFLTAYIKMKKIPIDEKNIEPILPPVFEELGNEPDPLDKFYSDAGANYSMYYNDLDIGTLKYLAKLIIGDYSLPLKTSIELFGDGIKYTNLETGPPKSVKAAKKGEKIKKPSEKMTKSQAVTIPESPEKKTTKTDKKNGKGKAKVFIVHEDKWTQIPSEDEEELEDIYESEIFLQIPGPGQEGWEYTTVSGPEELLIALATLWEAVEEIYINDLKQLFFLKRLNMNSVVPYAQFVKDIMKKDIKRPDYKGFYLAKFQKAFNVFDMAFRKDDEFKGEMYCRTEDFKEKLAEMCDEKMMNLEDARCKIISGNWTPHQITYLLNDYINMFQIEMDRFTETFRIINDYFFGVFTGMPSEEEFSKEDILARIKEIPPEIINNMLQNIDSTLDLSFFEDLLANLIQKVNIYIKKLNANTSNIMEKVKSMQSNNKPKSKASSPKSKASKEDKQLAIEIDTIKENYSKLLDEWQCAIKGETLRVSLRLELLKNNALQSLREFVKIIQDSLHDVYNEIRSEYWKEMENIQNACNIFHAAIELEKPVQKEFIFIDNTFHINPNVNLFDNAPIVPKLPREIVEEGAFTIAQLSKLVDILLDLCPSGYILRTSFIFILQDIIWNTPEDGSELMVPNLWRQLDSPGLRTVIDELYDDLEYVYWKDFIIYNLRINFPTERELLLTRKRLKECDPDSTELIEDYQFYGTKMWFENTYMQEDATKVKEAKQLLHKLYYVKNCGINYTALLLDFCKDEHLLEGFGKALELSLGKIVCWNRNTGNTFEEEFLQKMLEHDESVRLRDEERDIYYKIAYEEVCKLVDYVVHISEDIVIEDYIEEQQNPKESQLLESKENEKHKPKRTSILKNTANIETSRRVSKGEEIKFKDVPELRSKQSIDKSNSSMKENSISNLEPENEPVEPYKDLPDNVETDATEYSQVEFFLPLDVVITVITTALPWHARVQIYEELSFWEQAAEIYEKSRNPNFNMSVLTHEFLNSDAFLKLIGMTKKFKAMDPVKIVKNVVDSSK